MEQHSEMGPPPTATTVDPPSYAESVAETLDLFFFPDWHYRGGCDDSMLKTLDDLLNKDLSFMHPGTDFYAFYSFLLKMGEQRLEVWSPEGLFHPSRSSNFEGHIYNEPYVKECYFIVQETISPLPQRSGVAGKLVSLFDKSKQVQRKYWVKATLHGERYVFREVASGEEPMPEECVGVRSICYKKFWA
ncbi:hypothetical protein BDV35DRAFT_390892 [Aspergillus flavus]|uniref:Uncharacterized protein n=1 Tax=Aspergillus flavus TaxID=5059 RepID=A0A5N6H3D4_ASPFL|nr:hypothetical protein BDV35DRAFT_390892 [Aspergillus flavus]